MMRWLVRGLGGLLLLALVLAAGVFFESQRRLGRTIEVSAAEIELPDADDTDALERGEHLAVIRGCAGCHGADYGGETVVDDPAVGFLHAPNLTAGAGSVVDGYETEDWVRAIRHGVARDGRPLIMMPSEEYTVMDETDLGAMIAYLGTMPEVDRASPELRVGPMARVLLLKGDIQLAADHIDHVRPIKRAPSPNDLVAYGEYLATTCTGCHGPEFSGGKIPGAPPDWPESANLTPHEETGLGGWSESDFVTTLRTGRRPDGRALSEVMPVAQFGQFKAGEMRALWSYLQSLPPKEAGNR
jgi:mono/diheme cytochrome c family protein